jgi:serine/threonine protein kinase
MEEEKKIRFRQGDELGQGAYGRVYLGLNEDTGQLIAVKQVQLSGDRSEEAAALLEALKGEIRIMARLRHDNIVAYLGSDTKNDVLEIFLEFVPGGSIHSLLKKFGRFNEQLVRVYTKQILTGLAYLHSHQIMHRDIKGGNILVDNAGICKLADFGASARMADLSVEGAKSLHGTPYWMAPEVIKQTGHGRQADIWSVGCTVIEMATGRPPWHNFTSSVSAMFHIATTTDHPSMPEGFSEEGLDFIKLCLTRNPARRPNSIVMLSHPWLNLDQTLTHAHSTTASLGGVASSSSVKPQAVAPKSARVFGPPRKQQPTSPQPKQTWASPTTRHTNAQSSPMSPHARQSAQHAHSLKPQLDQRVANANRIADETLVSSFLRLEVGETLNRLEASSASFFHSYAATLNTSTSQRPVEDSHQSQGQSQVRREAAPVRTRERDSRVDQPIISSMLIEDKQRLQSVLRAEKSSRIKKQQQWDRELAEELQYQRSLRHT